MYIVAKWNRLTIRGTFFLKRVFPLEIYHKANHLNLFSSTIHELPVSSAKISNLTLSCFTFRFTDDDATTAASDEDGSC